MLSLSREVEPGQSGGYAGRSVRFKIPLFNRIGEDCSKFVEWQDREAGRLSSCRYDCRRDHGHGARGNGGTGGSTRAV